MRMRLGAIDEIEDEGGVRVCKVETEKCPGQESGPVLHHLFLPAV